MKKSLIILIIVLIILLLLIGCFQTFYSTNSSKNGGQFKASNYVLNSDGNTISDNANNLMLLGSSGMKRVDWNEAIEYCDSLTLNELSDWRLPTKDELILVYTGLKDTSFWNNEYQIYGYWSSDTMDDNPTFAYGFTPPLGEMSPSIGYRGKSDSFFYTVLCVRSIQ